MPKLWSETIEEHRREVSDAIVDAAAALVIEQGLLSVTMSQIAEATGIGRATLYKYFPDVEGVLEAWHDRQVTSHLENLREVRGRPGDAGRRLKAVLEAYAFIVLESRGHYDTELTAFLHGVHRGEHVAQAQHHVRDIVRDLLAEAVGTGVVRDDVAPSELASYCLHALAAASDLSSQAAVRRLVAVVLAGLQPKA